jgi:hypothetical protein
VPLVLVNEKTYPLLVPAPKTESIKQAPVDVGAVEAQVEPAR